MFLYLWAKNNKNYDCITAIMLAIQSLAVSLKSKKREFMKPAIIFLICFFVIRTTGHSQVTSFDIDESRFKTELLPTLDTIYKEDQSYRRKFLELTTDKAPQKAIDSIRSIVRQKDSINLIKVNKILNQYGWLGPQDVGMNGSQALFLVIQHADLKTQQKYLPMIKKAEKEGKTLSSNLAILQDRIAMREGKKQIYGSQGFKDKTTGISYIYPMINPDKLDKRRKSMGLQPMKEYNEGWNVNEYKKKLPEIEKIIKKQNIH